MNNSTLSRPNIRWLLLVSAALLVVDPSHGQDSTWILENVGEYGNCIVSDHMDRLTDERYHSLTCSEDHRVLNFNVYPELGRFSAIFSTMGAYYDAGDRVNVAYRVDSGRLREGTWVAANGVDAVFYRYPTNTTWLTNMLNEIMEGDLFLMRVGDISGVIALNGSREAVTDFVARIAHIQIAD